MPIDPQDRQAEKRVVDAIVDRHAPDASTRQRWCSELIAPTRLGQVTIVDAGGRPPGLAAWAFLTIDSARLLLRGKPVLMDIGDWNEGHIVFPTHFLSGDMRTTLRLGRSILANLPDRDAVILRRRPSANGMAGWSIHGVGAADLDL